MSESDMSREWRLIKRDGEIAQQMRDVTITVKPIRWWRPWVYAIAREYGEWVDYPIIELHTFKVGERVRVKADAGFNRGAEGIITYIEPNRRKVWVRRDGASSDVYYSPDELTLI